MTGRARFTGRTALVTGAAGGIGRVLTARLALEGARVVGVDLLDAPLGEGAASWFTADVRDPEALAEVHRAVGPVDLVVAAAGAMHVSGFGERPAADWARVVDVNLTGTLNTAHEFLPDLEAAAAAGQPADLVLLGGIVGRAEFRGLAVHGAAQAAVERLASSLRSEYGARGVRIGHCAPGYVDTPMARAVPEAYRRGEWPFADADMLRPEDIAEVLAFALAQPADVSISEIVVAATRQGWA